jgi:hypothetical protein
LRTRVGHQLRIHFADGDIAERFTVQALDVIGREQRHLRIFFRQLKGDIRNHHPERERFDADFFIGVFAFGIKETQDIGMMGVQIDRAGPWRAPSWLA